jgi:hypothetical protein
MPAVATGLARVRGVHQNERYASRLRLVVNEEAQLKECPTVQDSPLALASNRYPAADVLEILQRYSSAGALRRPHNGLANAMVDVAHKALLASTALLQQPFCALGSFLLQLGAQPTWRAAADNGHARY